MRAFFGWVFLVLGVSAFGLIPIHGPSRDRQSDEPNCAQAREIVQWSASHYGGGKRIDIKSDAFAQKVAENLVDKLDPRRLLFIESEISGLKMEHKNGWNAFLSSAKCEFYEAWVSQKFVAARARLQASLRALDLSIQKRPLVESKGIAATHEELERRISAQISQTLREVRADVLKAYGGDRRAFVLDSLAQIISEESLPLATKPRLLLAKAALGAMDSFSTYLSDSEFLDLHEDLAGGTTGVGVLLRKVPTGLFVENLVAGAPAERASALRIGDVITHVDGTDVVSLPFSESRKLFRGMPQSQVTLSIVRGDQKKAVVITRAPFAFENSKIEPERPGSNPSVLVIDIPSFYASSEPGVETSSAEDVRKVLLQSIARRSRPSAIVLDVRGNPGGYLEEAVEMAGLFVGERPVVSVVESRGKRTLREEGAIALFDGPVVVLQDDESASAAEILAGALRDYERAIVVGTPRSYGKGSVQRLYDLDTESLGVPLPGVVKLTTSVFYTPLGHNPSNGGIRSDIVVSKPDAFLREPRLAGPPDLFPIVESSLLAKIKRDRPRMAAVRSALRSLSESRLAEESSADALHEAVRVASDWVAYERKQSAEKKKRVAD